MTVTNSYLGLWWLCLSILMHLFERRKPLGSQPLVLKCHRPSSDSAPGTSKDAMLSRFTFVAVALAFIFRKSLRPHTVYTTIYIPNLRLHTYNSWDFVDFYSFYEVIPLELVKTTLHKRTQIVKPFVTCFAANEQLCTDFSVFSSSIKRSVKLQVLRCCENMLSVKCPQSKIYLLLPLHMR